MLIAAVVIWIIHLQDVFDSDWWKMVHDCVGKKKKKKHMGNQLQWLPGVSGDACSKHLHHMLGTVM